LFVDSIDRKGLYADTGILKCSSGMTCAPDSNSSTGGRCTAVTVQSAKFTFETLRRLDEGTACTFSNGTIGKKCIGRYACYNADEANIGCGSCIGASSCLGMGDTVVREGSCIGEEACSYVKFQSTIGPNSCIGELSCATAGEVTVESNSCQGYKSCYV
jgi:NDP-sugar pyrophosphorylase family protein